MTIGIWRNANSSRPPFQSCISAKQPTVIEECAIKSTPPNLKVCGSKILIELLIRAWTEWLTVLPSLLAESVAQGSVRQRGDQIAQVIARSLGERHVFCDLFSSHASVLEHNVSGQVAARFKRAARERHRARAAGAPVPPGARRSSVAGVCAARVRDERDLDAFATVCRSACSGGDRSVTGGVPDRLRAGAREHARNAHQWNARAPIACIDCLPGCVRRSTPTSQAASSPQQRLGNSMAPSKSLHTLMPVGTFTYFAGAERAHFSCLRAVRTTRRDSAPACIFRTPPDASLPATLLRVERVGR